MSEAKCPYCGCQTFYIKNPDDAYDMYEFDLNNGETVFKEDADPSERPECTEETETFCNQCAWHGKFRELKR